MKILTITNTFPPRKFGGVTEVSYQLSKNLAKIGNEVDVYTTDVGNEKFSRLDVDPIVERDDLSINYFKNINNYMAFEHNLIFPYKAPINIFKKIDDYDVIHLHDFRTLFSVCIHPLAKKKKIPYVVHGHGSLIKNSKKLTKNIFDKMCGYDILRNASKVIALNKTEANQYNKMGVDYENIEILPNGIELSEYENLPSEGNFREKYNINKEEKIILYLGRLHKSKGIDLLLEAFANAHEDKKDMRLVLIGPDQGYKSQLEELAKNLSIENKTIFAGYVSSEEKKEALIDADIFVTPKFTGFPITFVEACACGTPIITTDENDYLDWIDNNVGFVVDYTSKSISQAILKIFENERLMEKFSENAVDITKERFNWKKIAKNFEKIYKGICEQGI